MNIMCQHSFKSGFKLAGFTSPYWFEIQFGADRAPVSRGPREGRVA